MCKRQNLYVLWLISLIDTNKKLYKSPIYKLVNSSISAYANAKHDTMIGKIRKIVLDYTVFNDLITHGIIPKHLITEQNKFPWKLRFSEQAKR